MKRTILFLLLALSVFTLHACGTARTSNRTSLPVSQNMTDSLIVVKGVVKDAEDGTPIIGVCVSVQGTDPGKAAVRDVDYSLTNQNGEFSLRVAPGALLVTECLVYLPSTCKAEPDMVIELKRDLDALEDAIKTLSMYDVRTLCH